MNTKVIGFLVAISLTIPTFGFCEETQKKAQIPSTSQAILEEIAQQEHCLNQMKLELQMGIKQQDRGGIYYLVSPLGLTAISAAVSYSGTVYFVDRFIGKTLAPIPRLYAIVASVFTLAYFTRSILNRVAPSDTEMVRISESEKEELEKLIEKNEERISLLKEQLASCIETGVCEG